MAEPAAIWATKQIIFDKSLSNTQNIILSQGRAALQALISHIDRVHDLWRSRLTENVSLDNSISSTLFDICTQQGLASTILFDEVVRSKENAAARALRSERVNYVKAETAKANIQVLNDRKVRNALVHMDEYLAVALRKPNTGWFIDMAVRSRSEFSPTSGINVDFCRCYIGAEDVILHLGHEIKLSAVRQEASDILRLVFSPTEIVTPPAPIPTIKPL